MNSESILQVWCQMLTRCFLTCFRSGKRHVLLTLTWSMYWSASWAIFDLIKLCKSHSLPANKQQFWVQWVPPELKYIQASLVEHWLSNYVFFIGRRMITKSAGIGKWFLWHVFAGNWQFWWEHFPLSELKCFTSQDPSRSTVGLI